ncbi:hypothetical protein D9756_005806 [Leucocoprinus leucothites]|uniref:N-acetyltransferase domain-containing protein n=1 Tax=Leucocoprinus leucothites TaxID=201217 RepID=A0A8H5D2I4_9AGAR|nr:hypothetical protein D9756_005806 [Leucoagaricus leucothites]
MSDSRLGPFEVNPRTQEPMIRLRKHQNIVITPPRESDIPCVIPHLNDERVHIWLGGPPYPYTTEHARNWITRIKNECDLGLKDLNDALKDATTTKPLVLSHLPVRFLRELQEDGTDVYLGDIGLTRCPQVEVLDNPELDSEANSSLPAGHPSIVWTFGDWLVPSHHRRGIMSDAVDTVIHDLAKPLLGATHFTAMVFSGNEGSNKVFLKNGFTLVRHIADHSMVKGFMRDLNVFERCDRDSS